MTAKEYLSQLKDINYTIWIINEQLQEINAELYSLGSPAGKLSYDRVDTSFGISDKKENLINKALELEKKLEKERRKLSGKKLLIISQINKVSDKKQRAVLNERYVKCKKWEVIAEEMDVSVRYIYKLHGYALQSFAKVVKIKG